MYTVSASRFRVGLAGIVLALAGGCVQQVNYLEKFAEPGRNYVVILEGPKKPIVRHTPGRLEVRFGRHDLQVEKDRIIYDQKDVVAIDPEARSIDIRITRERIRVRAGPEILYRTLASSSL